MSVWASCGASVVDLSRTLEHPRGIGRGSASLRLIEGDERYVTVVGQREARSKAAVARA